MRRDNQHWAALSAPPGQRERCDAQGLADYRRTFLADNRLSEHWTRHKTPVFTIAEIGFGCGLNFLLTWDLWRQRGNPDEGARRLHYIAIEANPPHRTELSATAAHCTALAPLAAALCAQYPQPLPGVHRVVFDTGTVILDLWWGPVEDVLADLRQAGVPLVDSWYTDGGRGTVTAGELPSAQQSQLAALGRAHSTADGEHPTPAVTAPARLPPRWDQPWHSSAPPAAVLVLGAGLAGCHTAAALARRGLAVTVLESGEPAQRASGNAQGVLYTRLSHRHSALTDFALASFDFAVRQYRHDFAAGRLREGLDGALCGSFHQVQDSRELDRMRMLLTKVPELAQVVDAAQASQLIGLEQHSAGYWYPQSGWLSPPAVCAALLRQANVTLQAGCGTLQLVRSGHQWQAVNANGQVIAEAPAAVVAAGTACSSFAGLEWLPLRAIRGQTTQLPSLTALAPLRAALCHRGYIAPARAGEHCIGATFGPGDCDPNLRPADQAYNLAQLTAALPTLAKALDALEDTPLAGRTEWRCASPDYLPLVGPVPEREAFMQRFAALRDNARQPVAAQGVYLEGLYLNTGHGSRGLTSTPLAAELLASQLCGESLPVEPETLRALAPARFLLRDLGRNRI
ncbi:FAD-dependent 5-carboxymethylaminomethyl-2-thiouridine(34) oxidoreductase MnmC [Haliea sp.]|uniref:FAD-dependent 5-carboxymethylaminomethyl-2-thiouridine(34) oxidoreductase MnmC n=1 Tax=Haliea sp. TaxID=1932666 RepID=UPI0035281319